MSVLQIAQEAWGAGIPAWVEDLARACDETSQAEAARALGRSASLVNQVLRRKYPGDMAGVEARVRGVFGSEMIDCPALGRIGLHSCQDWQGKSRRLVSTNSRRLMMFRACNRCPLRARGSASNEGETE